MVASHTQIKCIVPFTRFEIYQHGYCYTCCPGWSKIGNVGRITPQNTLMDIWNNERMQFIRRAVLEDQLGQVCNFRSCPYAHGQDYLNLETLKKENDPNFNLALDQIMAGKTILENPPYSVQIANSGKCNLKCIMCLSNDKCQKDDQLFEEQLFSTILPDNLPGISRLSLSGNGEVLFNPYSRRFLQNLDAASYPSLRIELYTNGTLLSPNLWESIAHNQYDDIFVSIDAASEATYKKIRRNGNWERLRRNLEFISGLRRQNVFYYFCINFIVMKSNYREMKDFVELGRSLGCDRIIFQKIQGSVDVREDINLTRNQKIWGEIARILTDPIFSRPEVDTQGIDEYRKYHGRKISWGSVLITKASEWLLYFPVQAYFWITKRSTLVVFLSEFVQKKRIWGLKEILK